jgi:hypothetical protein
MSGSILIRSAWKAKPARRAIPTTSGMITWPLPKPPRDPASEKP